MIIEAFKCILLLDFDNDWFMFFQTWHLEGAGGGFRWRAVPRN